MVTYNILDFNILRNFSYIQMLNTITITHSGGGGIITKMMLWVRGI